jgi:glycosyltransferase involved in cell wall biosynthesis
VVLDLRPLQCGYSGKGIGRFTRELAGRIAAWAHSPDSRNQFKIQSLVMSGRENPFPSIPVLIEAPSWKRPWIWDQVCLPALLLRHRVYIFHNFVALGPLPEISFPILWRRRAIAQIHDWHMFSETATDIEHFYRQTARIRIQKKGLKRVKHIVVDSERVKAEAILQGIPADRITVLELGCDHFNAIKPEPWPMENFILSVGDTANKNLSFALKVIQDLRSKSVLLHWVIIGNRAEVMKQLGLTDGKLEEWMTILETPSDGRLKSCYLQALVLLFPSTQEGFGIPVLEAMALGCPVLASNIEPLASLVEFKPSLLPLQNSEVWSNAISQLWKDQDFRRAMTEAGKLRASKFTWDQASQTLVRLYGDTIAF